MMHLIKLMCSEVYCECFWRKLAYFRLGVQNTIPTHLFSVMKVVTFNVLFV